MILPIFLGSSDNVTVKDEIEIAEALEGMYKVQSFDSKLMSIM